MRWLARRFSLVFAAGVVGGLAESGFLWLCGLLGVTAALGVDLAPELTLQWLLPRLVWAGLWGALFLLPFLRTLFVIRGILYSAGPILTQSFIVLPVQLEKGIGGIGMGGLTPLFVIVSNLFWGIGTAMWLRYIEKGDEAEI